MIEIRKYKDEDNAAVRKICMDTAKPGYNKSPRKRECMCYMFVDYSLEQEKDNCFVAVDNGKVCGYIVCSTDKQKYIEKMKQIYIPKVFKKSFILGVFAKICLSTSKKLDEMFDGGGLHINIDAEHQGQKIGPKLLTALALHLKSIGHKYMYLVTQNRKTRGYGFYMHYGFYEAKKCGAGTLCLTYDVDNVKNK